MNALIKIQIPWLHNLHHCSYSAQDLHKLHNKFYYTQRQVNSAYVLVIVIIFETRKPTFISLLLMNEIFSEVTQLQSTIWLFLFTLCHYFCIILILVSLCLHNKAFHCCWTWADINKNYLCGPVMHFKWKLNQCWQIT